MTLRSVVPVFIFLILTQCTSASNTPVSTSTSSATTTTTVTLTNSVAQSFQITAEVADTPATRALGLMYRESLDANAGMLFVFDAETENPFWMKNTPVSLDIIFISADKEIISIAANTTPYSEDLIYASAAYLYTLEVNAGYAAAHSIAAGDLVEF